MSKWIGLLIRRERLRRSFSQEGLCRGICAVSYLSKIEQGKAEAGEDILLPLLERLGIRYEAEPDFLHEAEVLVEALYGEFLSGRDHLSSFSALHQRLLAQKDRLLTSPLMLDAMLLLALKERDTAKNLAEFSGCMSPRQYALYLYLCLDEADTAEELLRLDPCAVYTIAVGSRYLWRGQYTEAIELTNRGYDLAAREGHVYLMIQAKLALGNCYSSTGHRDLMLESYRITRNLAEAVKEDLWSAYTDYNTASSYLEWGMPQEAYALLKASPMEGEALYFHKLAIASEQLGRPEEALTALERGATLLQPPDTDSSRTYRELFDLVRYRLTHPDYLQDGVYAALMEDTFNHIRRDLTDGFVRFHVPYMLQTLEADRRYKDAYRLMKEYFHHQ